MWISTGKRNFHFGDYKIKVHAKLWAKKRKTDQKDDDDEAKKNPIASTAGTKIIDTRQLERAKET